MGELKGGHKKCSVEGCEKYVVKEDKCTRHFNEAHGIVKTRGRIAKAKKDSGQAGMTKNTSGRNGDHGIIEKLRAERNRIDQAIDVIEKYTGAGARA